ncbi:MAG: peptidoglycan bridge formation glycyltransferase FemA/FemB family protein [Clostridia bacterium]|nr:peptidoglycan bridge formation glycyltransferase FemA/FemB family protein [Clostridia bacterium]
MKLYTAYKELPEEILSKLDEANVFFSKEYFDYLLNIGKNVVFFATEDYIIPYEIKKKSIFSFGHYLSEPFCIGNNDSEEKRKAFINDAQKYIGDNKLSDWQESVGAYTMFDVYPDSSKRIGFGNLVVNLENDTDTLLSNMTSKHRNMVRRAEKDGTKVKMGGMELLGDYCELDKETWKRSGQPPVERAYYENILKCMPDSSFIAISYFDGVPQSGMLCYYNKQMMYYMYGASTDRPTIGANNFLHWEMMKEMKKRGVKRYSFVGYRLIEDIDPKLAGIQHFKKGFGGELIEGYLFKETFSPLKKKMFDILYMLKNRKAVEPDAIDGEIDKWENINS